MSYVSVLVPARNEKYLSKTINDIYTNAIGDIEVIIVLDGETQYPIPEHRPNLKIIKNKEPIGLTASIDKAASASEGDYLIKTDSHCRFGEGFNAKLLKNIEENWVVVPRRWTLDLETWQIHPRMVDYFYLSCPWTHPQFMMQSCTWISKTEQKQDTLIDDMMCFQGSMWMMSKKHWKNLRIFESIGDSYAEHHEISMRTWLGGGRVVINKNAWYAHPKRYDERGYRMSINKIYRDHKRSATFWINNEWKDRVHDFDWLIDKFWPLPLEHTRHRLEKYFWETDWRKYYDRTL